MCVIRSILIGLCLAGLAASLTGCNADRDSLVIYPLIKEEDYERGLRWTPVPPIEFKVKQDHVVVEVLGTVREEENCRIKSSTNWECYDQPHRFGFNGGNFWTEPHEPDLKYVSQWHYNGLRCLSEFGKADPFRAAYHCVAEWQ